MSDLTADTITADIARAIATNQADIAPEDDLLDLGVDSIVTMELIDTWRSAGAHVEFADLAALQTVAEWVDAILAAEHPA